MNWPKSRYTASLEQQVIDLKAEVLRLQNLNNELAHRFLSLGPAQATPAPTPVPAKRRQADDQDERPKAGNWIRSRDAAEVASDTKYINFAPPPERQRRTREEVTTK